MAEAGGAAGRPRVVIAAAAAIVLSIALAAVAVRTVVTREGRAALSTSPHPVGAGDPLESGVPVLAAWDRQAVARSMDGFALAVAGIEVPEGASVFAARIFGGRSAPTYRLYGAGGGAFSQTFHPASTVKLLAALGAVDFATSLGFTGAAIVDDGPTLREIYDAAIRQSSNEDYDLLVRIAGADRLNLEFLPAHGFADTVIQVSYTGGDVAYSPAMVLAEGDRRVEVPARTGAGTYGCGGSNCSSLFDLADAIRRVVLDAEIPATERFAIGPDDIAALQDALLGADGWMNPGVYEVLGPEAQVFSKPGYVGGMDCVDHAVVSAPRGERYLIALSTPDVEGCEVLAILARQVIAALSDRPTHPAVRTGDPSVPVEARPDPP